MPVSVVVGGQFGSEGKGKVAHWVAKELDAAYAVRIGGSNSGHTVIDDSSRSLIFRHLPTASIIAGVTSVIGPGSYIDPDVLLSEIQRTGLSSDQLLIDPNAVLVTEECRKAELESGLVESIGSTGSGTGAAVISRIQRSTKVSFVGDDIRLAPFVRPTREVLRAALNKNQRIVIEGTQGFGLSLLHSDCYPKVTSRDTTAAAFISETGLSPLDVDDIVMVIRAFPIRVAGESGHLPNETSWGEITRSSGSATSLLERTTVTHKVRRVALFDARIVRDAIAINTPTRIVLNHVDYADSKCAGRKELTQLAQVFIDRVESDLGAEISYVGTSSRHIVRYRIDCSMPV